MTSRTRSPRRAGPFPLRTVLVLSDLSSDAENAAWRGALLAQEHGAVLHIVHPRAWHEPQARSQRQLDALAWQLQQHLQIVVVASSQRGGLRHQLANATRMVDLVVMPASLGRGFSRAWLGHWPPGKLAACSRLPVLVVRRPAAVPYRRVIAGVPQAPLAAACIAAAAGMAGGPHVELLRELDPLHDRPRKAPGESAVRDKALEARIHELAGPDMRMREAPCIVLTTSAEVLVEQEQTLLPDLIVVPGAARERRWFEPSAPERVLPRHARADTLIVPEGRAARSGESRLQQIPARTGLGARA